MQKRLPYFLLSLAFATSLRAGPLGAVVASWDIDPTKNTVTLHMLNNTSKDITFYNVSIKETYGQNINEHQFSQELPNVSILIYDPNYIHAADLREYYHGGNGTWEAGKRRDQVIAIQPGLTHFEAVLDTVTYDDKTAETTNSDALERELANRKSAAQTLQATNEAIRHALANTADQSPHETAAKEIEGLQKKWEAAGRVGNFSPGASGGIISDLKEAPAAAAYLKQTLPDYLTNMLLRNEKLASLYLEHSTPKAGGSSGRIDR